MEPTMTTKGQVVIPQALRKKYRLEPSIKKVQWIDTGTVIKLIPIPKDPIEAKEREVKIIEVRPLITPLTGLAGFHLRLRPGTSCALAPGMARVIISENLLGRPGW